MSIAIAEPGAAPGSLVTDDLQIEWRGMLMGPGSFFGYKRLSGWEDQPQFSTNFVDRPRAHGSFAGPMFSNERIVSFETQMYPGMEDIGELLAELEARTGPSDEDHPLVIRQHGKTRLAYARVTGRAMPINRAYMQGFPTATLQWTCSDPRRYDVEPRHAEFGPEQTTGGLDWSAGLNWGAGLDWGTSLGQPQVTVVNEGNVDSPLYVVVRGALTAPFYVRSSAGWQVGIDRSLSEGDIQIIDAREDRLIRDGVHGLDSLSIDSHAISDATVPRGSSVLELVSGAPGDTGRAAATWHYANI